MLGPVRLVAPAGPTMRPSRGSSGRVWTRPSTATVDSVGARWKRVVCGSWPFGSISSAVSRTLRPTSWTSCGFTASSFARDSSVVRTGAPMSSDRQHENAREARASSEVMWFRRVVTASASSPASTGSDAIRSSSAQNRSASSGRTSASPSANAPICAISGVTGV